MEKYTQKAVDATKIFTTHMTTNELKRAVTKATLDEEAKPRLKDVKKIIRATYLRPSSSNTKCGPRKVLKYLQQRLEAAEYAVVLRALLVCHILLDEGSKSFVDLLLHSAVTFNLPYLRDHVSEYAQYTKAFARYLQEKIITVRTLGMSYDTIPDPSKKSRQQLYEVVPEDDDAQELYGDVNRLEMTELLQVLPVVETQTESLIAVRLSSDAAYNDLTVGVLERLVKDMLPLMKQLNDGMGKILEDFFTLSKSECEQSLKLYERYIELVHGAERLLGIARRLGASETQSSIEHVALDYISGMKEHVNTLKESKGDKTSDIIPESKDKLNPNKENYDEAAAVAAAIRESLKTGKSSEMITFDDDDSDDDANTESHSTEASDDEQSDSTKELDDFFGLFKGPEKKSNSGGGDSKDKSKTPEKSDKKKKKKKSTSGEHDDLLDLFSDASISRPSQGNFGYPPPPPPSSSSFAGGGYYPPSFMSPMGGAGYNPSMAEQRQVYGNPFEEPQNNPFSSPYGVEGGNPYDPHMPPPAAYYSTPSYAHPSYYSPSSYPPPPVTSHSMTSTPWNHPMEPSYPPPPTAYGDRAAPYYYQPYEMQGGAVPERWAQQPPPTMAMEGPYAAQQTPFDEETSNEEPFDELNPFTEESHG
ncbi:Clathrin coat assembly protein AP180 [Galdieria sulphuraria]|uniref:Clathrin assembly protein AP179 n=1 Tax=Galdieria sulphuraria TaxID=130081 RepID=M2VU89_GALSU|nr:clathrin assembly protein AP179 [Galdieria sulphuraria]EME26756.1 clathrin assembly protein AP179 [Galdieria sulphuraria]GJD07029.1 Clathrin coat assembly protein AP180 [Galdieria sulphuraria]|eukprot:XP_005703276.1 clathrin assembly protein AP179 [Galdieria sulphuraria]